jgi:hypothetical protein
VGAERFCKRCRGTFSRCPRYLFVWHSAWHVYPCRSKFAGAYQSHLPFTQQILYAYRAVVGGSQTWQDNLIAIVINLLIAAYFWNVLKENWRTLQETDAFAEIRRLYRFIWVLYGLLMMVYGAQQALSYAFNMPSNVLGEVGREIAVNAIALLLIGSPIWFYFGGSYKTPCLTLPKKSLIYAWAFSTYFLSRV